MDNKLFENIIIISDLDGTFVDDNSRIVEKNISKIEYFKAHGGRFSFATGRTLNALKGVIPNLDNLCNFPAIMCNGAYIYDFGKKQKSGEKFLHRKYAFEYIKNIISLFPKIGCRIDVGDYFACPVMSEHLSKEKQKSKFLEYRQCCLDEIKNLNWYKCVFVAENKELVKLKEYTDSHKDDNFVFCFSSPHLFEILSKGATKGDRIKDLKEYAHNPNVKIFAIGDEENDRVMLETADFAACPSNAIEDIKQIPDIIKVCSNNNGAICDLIEDIENNINIYNA